MRVAYDFDGVLAQGPHFPPDKKPWRHMNGAERQAWREYLIECYANALKILPILEPEFWVISARKEEPEVRRTSEEWLDRYYSGRWRGLHLLAASRTTENVVRFKSEVLIQLGATDFYEDNKTVVRGLRALKLKTRIWLVDPATGTCSL